MTDWDAGWSEDWDESEPGFVAANDQVMAEVNGLLQQTKAFVIVGMQGEDKAMVVGRGHPQDEELLATILYEALSVRPRMQEAVRRSVLFGVDMGAAAKEYEQHLKRRLEDLDRAGRSQRRALYMLYAAAAFNLIAGAISIWRIFS